MYEYTKKQKRISFREEVYTLDSCTFDNDLHTGKITHNFEGNIFGHIVRVGPFRRIYPCVSRRIFFAALNKLPECFLVLGLEAF